MRIPIVFNGADEGDAFLVEGDRAAPQGAYAVRFTMPEASFGHPAGCTCCTPRGPVADALAAMFRARATGQAPFFRRLAILASPAGERLVRDTVSTSVIAAARYSLT